MDIQIKEVGKAINSSPVVAAAIETGVINPLLVLFAVIGVLVFIQPSQAQGRYVGFDYFFKPIPAQTVPNTLSKMMFSNAVVDSVKKYFDEGTLCFKPNVTVALTAFDKTGTPSPFSGVGAGISFQREINKSGVNKTTVEVDLDWLVFRSGNGPALLVGVLNGACIGGAYDVKSKQWYALTNYTATLWKN